MSRPLVLGVFSLIACGALSAGSNVIGVAVSDTSVVINNALVDGNANLSSGSRVRTETAASRLRMTDGSYVFLGRSSEGQVFEKRFVLERGASQLTSKSGYAVEAMGVRVAPQASARADVSVDKGRVVVTAVNGPVSVWNSQGVPVANMTAGRSLSFQPAPAGAASSLMRGKLVREGDRFVLPDEVSGLKVELRGTGLDREAGQRVQVSGASKRSTDGSTQIVEVAKLTRLEEEPMPGGGGAPNPTPNPKPAAQASSAGLWIGTLVVVGVAGGLVGYFVASNPERTSP